MQSFWDLLPASLWPTQPFIPPDQQARIMQALWAQQASANSLPPATVGTTDLASTSAWGAPGPAPFASGDDDASTAGGILGALFGSSAGALPPTSFPSLPPPPQAAPFVRVASTANQLNPHSPPAAAPTAPQAGTGSNAAAPIVAPANRLGGGLGAAASWLTPGQRDASDREAALFGAPARSPQADQSQAPNFWATLPAIADAGAAQGAPQATPFTDFSSASNQPPGMTHTAPPWFDPPDTPANNRLFGLHGVECYQLFPERLVRGIARAIHDVATTNPIDPATGQFRPEAIEDAANIAMMATSSPSAAVRLEAVGSRVSDAANSLALIRKAELADGVAPAAAARAPSAAPTTLADQSSGASVTTPNVTSSAAATPRTVGEVDHVASPALGWSAIDELRAKWGVPTRDTVAVAHTDVPGLEDLNLEGGSPLVRDEARLPRVTPWPTWSPSKIRRDQNHAEQDIANQFIGVVERRGIGQSDMDGRTLTMRLSQPPCSSCLSGLDSDASPGVLKQLSDRYRNLTIVVEYEVDLGPGLRGIESFAIKDRRYVGQGRR